MSRSYCNVHLSGRLARDPRPTQSGSAVFMTVVTDGVGRDGKEFAIYHDVVGFGAFSNIAGDYAKGDFVCVEGPLNYRSVDEKCEYGDKFKYSKTASVVISYIAKIVEARGRSDSQGDQRDDGPPGSGGQQRNEPADDGPPGVTQQQRQAPEVYPFTDDKGRIWLSPIKGVSLAKDDIMGWEACIKWTDKAWPGKGGEVYGRQNVNAQWKRWEKQDPIGDVDADLPF